MNNAMLAQLAAERAGRARTTERAHTPLTAETAKTTQSRLCASTASEAVEGLAAAMATSAQDRCQKRPKLDGTDGKETISNANVIDLCASDDSDAEPVEVGQTSVCARLASRCERRGMPPLCCKDNDAASLALASRLLEDDSLSLARCFQQEEEKNKIGSSGGAGGGGGSAFFSSACPPWPAEVTSSSLFHFITMFVLLVRMNTWGVPFSSYLLLPSSRLKVIIRSLQIYKYTNK